MSRNKGLLLAAIAGLVFLIARDPGFFLVLIIVALPFNVPFFVILWRRRKRNRHRRHRVREFLVVPPYEWPQPLVTDPEVSAEDERELQEVLAAIDESFAGSAPLFDLTRLP